MSTFIVVTPTDGAPETWIPATNIVSFTENHGGGLRLKLIDGTHMMITDELGDFLDRFPRQRAPTPRLRLCDSGDGSPEIRIR